MIGDRVVEETLTGLAFQIQTIVSEIYKSLREHQHLYRIERWNWAQEYTNT